MAKYWDVDRYGFNKEVDTTGGGGGGGGGITKDLLWTNPEPDEDFEQTTIVLTNELYDAYLIECAWDKGTCFIPLSSNTESAESGCGFMGSIDWNSNPIAPYIYGRRVDASVPTEWGEGQVVIGNCYGYVVGDSESGFDDNGYMIPTKIYGIKF